MLYVTTRNDRDAFTAIHAMTHALGPDGGHFVPMQMPRLDGEGLEAVARRSFNENIAYVLNQLFGSALTGREIELVIGKRSAGIVYPDSRTMAAQIFKDADCTFDETVQRLFRLLIEDSAARPGQWFTMSVRIAMLFGIFGELMAEGIVSAEAPMDLAVPSFGFQGAMAAWYARNWGLPIGTIVCACTEDDAPWSLLHQGEMRTDPTLRRTRDAGCGVPAGLERLIAAVLGPDEVHRYVEAVEKGRAYELEQPQQELLRSGLFVSVITRRRTGFMIPNLYRTGRWYPDPGAANVCAALADYRSITAETGMALAIAQDNPLHACAELAAMLNIPADWLRRKLENT